MITNKKYTLVYKTSRNGFIVWNDIYVEYHPSEESFFDDRIRRIEEGIYKGDLIQNSRHMVYVTETNENVESNIEHYFNTYRSKFINIKWMNCDHDKPISTDTIIDQIDKLTKQNELVDRRSFKLSDKVKTINKPVEVFDTSAFSLGDVYMITNLMNKSHSLMLLTDISENRLYFQSMTEKEMCNTITPDKAINFEMLKINEE